MRSNSRSKLGALSFEILSTLLPSLILTEDLMRETCQRDVGMGLAGLVGFF